jgi:hypothetical protein
MAGGSRQGKTGSGIRDTVSFSNRAQARVSGSHPKRGIKLDHVVVV